MFKNETLNFTELTLEQLEENLAFLEALGNIELNHLYNPDIRKNLEEILNIQIKISIESLIKSKIEYIFDQNQNYDIPEVRLDKTELKKEKINCLISTEINLIRLNIKETTDKSKKTIFITTPESIRKNKEFHEKNKKIEDFSKLYNYPSHKMIDLLTLDEKEELYLLDSKDFKIFGSKYNIDKRIREKTEVLLKIIQISNGLSRPA